MNRTKTVVAALCLGITSLSFSATAATPAAAQETEVPAPAAVTNLTSTLQTKDRFVAVWDKVPGAIAYTVDIYDLYSDIETDLAFYEKNWIVFKTNSGSAHSVAVTPIFEEGDMREVETQEIVVTTKGIAPVRYPEITNYSQTSATLEWTGSPGATKYIVRKRIVGEENYERGGSVRASGGDTQHSLRMTDLEPGSEYSFKIWAVDAEGDRSSVILSGVTTVENFPGINRFESTFQTRERIVLNWDKYFGVNTYQIKVSEGDSFSESDHETFTSGGLWFTHRNLKPGTTYTYQIMDVDGELEPVFHTVTTRS